MLVKKLLWANLNYNNDGTYKLVADFIADDNSEYYFIINKLESLSTSFEETQESWCINTIINTSININLNGRLGDDIKLICINENRKEMTQKEIEKELGYKIKVVDSHG